VLCRDDANFDTLIEKIYPNRADLEEQEARLVDQAKEHSKIVSENRKRALERQLELNKGPKRRRQRRTDAEPTTTDDDVDAPELVNFSLTRHPSESSVGVLQRPYLRTSSDIKVHHLKSFLRARLNQLGKAFEIMILQGNGAVVLDDDVSLCDVSEHFWNGQEDLNLSYRAG